MCNLGSVGVWSVSGRRNGKVLGFPVGNASMPHVSQRDNLVAALYCPPLAHSSPQERLACRGSGIDTCAFWPPESSFDEMYVLPMRFRDGERRGLSSGDAIEWGFTSLMDRCAPGAWWVGRRGSVFVALACTAETSIGRVDDACAFKLQQTAKAPHSLPVGRDSNVSLGAADASVDYYLPRECHTREAHVWLCLVNCTANGVAGMDDFFQELRRVSVTVEQPASRSLSQRLGLSSSRRSSGGGGGGGGGSSNVHMSSDRGAHATIERNDKIDMQLFVGKV